METLPVVRDIQSLQTMAQMMVQSGFFKSMQDIAKAFVVIKAGEEMGIPAVASMRQIELVNGQINIRSHLMAAMIKRTGRYNYRVRENTAERCVIDFYENGELIGTSEFTMEDARLLKLADRDSYQRQPKVMLYNRAMSQGARMFCPDIFLGAIYTEGEIQDVEAIPVQPEQRQVPMMTPEPEKPKGEPASKEQLGMLYGLLKKHGVRDGSKSNLIARIYPDGITKREASDAISALKDSDKLVGAWINNYVGLLTEEEGEDKRQVSEWMKENMGTNKPEALTRDQQAELFAWITGDFSDIPDIPSDPPAEPKPSEPTPSNWALLVSQVCQGAGVSLDDLSAWAIDRWAPEGGVDDMVRLGIDAFNQLRGMDLDSIKEGVDKFSKQGVGNG